MRDNYQRLSDEGSRRSSKGNNDKYAAINDSSDDEGLGAIALKNKSKNTMAGSSPNLGEQEGFSINHSSHHKKKTTPQKNISSTPQKNIEMK